MRSRLGTDVFKVLTHTTDAFCSADGAVAGHDVLRGECLDARQRVDPRLRGALPADGRAPMEEYVARVNDGFLRNVNDQVAFGVGRPDVDHVDFQTVEIVGRVAVENGRGRNKFDARELERRELVLEVAQVLGWIDQRANGLSLRRQEMMEAVGTATVTDDLGVGEQLVAPAVIAVVVGVEQPLRGIGVHGGEKVDHALRKPQVVERVDNEAATARDQAGVAPPEAAVFLLAGIRRRAQALEFHEAIVRHGNRAACRYVPLSMQTSPRTLAALAGLAGAAAALALGELLSGLSPRIPSLVLAVGEAVIDFSPGDATETAIRTVGANDKPLLIAAIVALSLVIGAYIGVLTLTRRRAPWVGFGAFGVIGGAAAARNSFASFGLAWLSALAAAGLGAWVTQGLVALVRPTTGIATPSLRARRAFLVLGGGTAALAAAAALGGRSLRNRRFVDAARKAVATTGADIVDSAADKAVASLNTFDSIPGISPYITPIKAADGTRFYRIDTALSIPTIDASDWTLEIGGLVDAPFKLTYDELQSLPLEEHAITLSCVSNEIGGPLVATAIWTGVPLRMLIERARPTAKGRQVVGVSVDDFTAGFPLSVAVDGRNALVAIAMNGEPLPARHGFPARLVVPGLYGYVSAVKWLKAIKLEAAEYDSYWVPRGWSKLGPMKTMSRIDVPNRRAKTVAGPVAIAGVAWSPTVGVSSVEVKVDDGPWLPAKLASAVSGDTWVQWMLEWQASSGRHRITVRATDKAGVPQPVGPAAPRPDGAEGYHEVVIDVA